MPDPGIAIVTVASESYRDFAEALERSFVEYADESLLARLTLVCLDGIEGFPIGTECRHGIFADWLGEHPEYGYAFLSDADMRVCDSISADEILPPAPGIVATLHPGYVDFPPHMLPFEDRPESRAFVPAHSRQSYFCGGFIGGTREEILALSRAIDEIICLERDDGWPVRWHDESCLNHLLANAPPARILSPAFCHPAGDRYYRESVWGGADYPRKIVALDKTAEVRGAR